MLEELKAGTDPLVLVTNDDGIDAPGIALVAELAEAHAEVITVAPLHQVSATSQAITLHQPLRVRRRGPRRFAIDPGTPTDCIYLALSELAPRRPILVVSGINHGLNIGHDVIYSGTVAGARQAFIQEVSGLALSFALGGGAPIDSARPWVATVLGKAIARAARETFFLNVNVPNPGAGPIHGFRATHLGHRLFSNDVDKRRDPRGREYLWIGGSRVEMDSDPHSDTTAIRQGYVSVTPLALDTTDHARRTEIAAWPLFEEALAER